jgi:23S rRNA (adenine-N6)-dimethyltransferase
VASTRRRWGWHRLDPTWAERLVAEAALPPRALVLDVGAGGGALTEPLLRAGHRLIAVEAHPGRAAELRRRFGPDLVVVQADAGDLRLPRRPFHVVANPPFGVTSALLRRLLHRGSRLQSAVLVVQHQAAMRWAAADAPAIGAWGPHFEIRAGRRVPRSAFVPPPQVDCRVVTVRRR